MTGGRTSAESRRYEDYDLNFTRKDRAFTPEMGARVVEDLQAGMPDFNVRQYFGTQPTIFEDYDHLGLATDRADGRVLGLLASRWLRKPGVDSLYIWTAMVAGSHRQGALFKRLTRFFFERICEDDPRNLPDVVSSKTYNPVFYKLLQGMFPRIDGVRLYPEIPGPQDPALAELAGRIARALNPNLVLVEDTGAVLGGQAMVAPDFFPRMDRSPDERVNAHFAANLTRADQVLCVVTIEPDAKPAVLENLRRRAPDPQPVA
ncbi:hypothetical protein [Arenibaculum sp.]|jgi:hypothetical protein|uniref:hypothetical protein n=1 Tax=Arenibaculum sp. TaxID=2865862 RepID=UPI002E165DD9|nr:hypothetical protein [Arenibaculum sp.]